MNIKYFGLGSDLKEILFEEFKKNEEILYVFENTSSFFEIKREYLKSGEKLFYNFKLLKLYDFYEKLFQTDKIVLKEEKQVVLFYNSLTDEIKKELKINNYYDVIDIAYNFYGLFSELQEYKIDLNKIEIEKWQKNTFETLLKINSQINEKSDEKGLILPYMLRKSENISENFLKKYKKICFVNKVKFTPLEKEIFDVIEKKGIEIENILQLDKKDFNEEKLKISETFGLPDKEEFEKKYNVNVEIHEFENKFAQLLGIVKKLDKELKKERLSTVENKSLYKIYDAQDENSDNEKDYHLLNQNKITYNLEITMQKTKIYKTLDLIYNVLENIKVVFKSKEDKICLFRMKELHDAFKSRDFLKTFGLKENYRLFQDLVLDDYKYISCEKLKELSENVDRYKHMENEVKSFVNFLEKIEEIYSYKTLSEYAEFLEKIFVQSGEKDVNIRDKYFEALSEMTVLEDLSFDDLWTDFFGLNMSASLLKLFLKYLDKKAVSLDLEKIEEQENERKYTINPFSSISETAKENIMFLNIQDSFPKVKINNYLFSKIQRAKMGLPISDEEKQIEIFKFYQNVLGAKNIYLSYVKNIDEKIDSAGVIEEIKLKYGIEPVKNEISEEEELNFVKEYFNKSKIQRKIGKFIKSKLEKNKEKMRSEDLSLGFYDFEKMKDFEYGFYIEKMTGEKEIEKIDDKIEALMFGNIIHVLYEKIVMENKEALEKGEFTVSNGKIEKTLNRILDSLEYKIPKEYIIFYRKISFTEIVKSTERFLKELAQYLLMKRNIKIHSEEKIKKKAEKDIAENVRISGVVDLYIETEDSEILVDYKSGKDNQQNKNRAFNQLDYYSVILPENENKKTEKWVINAWTGEKNTDEDRKENDILGKEDIKEVIENYYKTDYYDLGERKETYISRVYSDIARREEELGDE